MSLENAKKFLADVAADETIQKKMDVEGSITNKMEAVAEGAKKLGYDFSVAELKEAALGESELSEDELENVAGGGGCVAFASGNCTCFGDGGNCTCFGDNCVAVFT